MDDMAAWLVWLIAGGVLAVAEMLSLSFVLLMFAGGAATAAIAAGLGAPVLVQLLAFGAVSLGMLVLVRPIVAAHLTQRRPDQIDGAQVYVGRIGVVSERVDDHHGRIKIGGDEWTAVTQTSLEIFDIGAKVRVMEIRGATAVVSGDLV